MKKLKFFSPGFLTSLVGLSLFFILVLTQNGYAQTPKDALKTEIYQLENGLTVYLNEDHSLPNIFGAVVVKGGSKRDPADATGIAHYFEHIMFKGTDRIGTLDFEKEKIFLDSISGLYDQLALTTEAEKIAGIQQEINRLSIKAAELAIPNETEKILGEMGCTALNAGTGYDGIAYFNVLPSNQLQKWLDIYSHRFINPVYRLFQSELETVYEEYNMYRDNRFSTAFEEYLTSFYPNHPYGVPIIGYPEHLKRPSMSKMHEYFNTYYVANNMALVLSGSFNTHEVKPLIEKYFGPWRSGAIPDAPKSWEIKPFTGRLEVEKKLTPVKFGLRGYRSVAQNHADAPLLDVIAMLLSNRAQTGLLDKLTVDNHLMAAQVISDRRTDAGGEYVLFVPKVIGQSLEKAEKLVEEKLNDLKAGKFDDDLLEAVKMEIVVSYQRNFEDQFSRGYNMISAFQGGRSWDDLLGYPEKVKNITKAAVVAGANQYFGENYLAFHSKTGLPKKKETLKPAFDNIPAKNTGEKSEYAKRIASMEVPYIQPHFIDFGTPGHKAKDVTLLDITDLQHLYWVENKVNDIFTLRIEYGIGTCQMPILNQTAEYLNLTGPMGTPFAAYRRELQKMGGTVNIYSTWDNFIVEINGPESSLKSILELVNKFLNHPASDDTKIRNLVESSKTNEKMMRKDPETLGYALYLYAVYGENSQFLKNLTSTEVKKLKADELIAAMKTALTYEADIHYSGNIAAAEIRDFITTGLQPGKAVNKSLSPARNQYRDLTGPTVFFLDEPSALQSKNYFFIKGSLLAENEKPLINAYYEYLDGGMSSIIFQEIREFRSLAYSTGANIPVPFYRDEPVTMMSFVGTQADKTREAIQVMHQIIKSPPDKADRMEMICRGMIQSINSKKPPFRQISFSVARWTKQGYKEDPRREWVKTYETMKFEDIVKIYDSQFYNKPVITTIIGKKKRIGTDWMNEYGKVVEVNHKDILK